MNVPQSKFAPFSVIFISALRSLFSPFYVFSFPISYPLPALKEAFEVPFKDPKDPGEYWWKIIEISDY